MLDTEIDPCQSITFCVKYCYKRPIFHLYRYSRETVHFSELKKNLLWKCDLSYSSHFENEEPKRPAYSLIFFKWWQIVDWDVLSANSWVLLRGLHFTNSLKTSWSWSEFFHRHIIRSKLSKLVLDFAVCIDTQAMNTRNFLNCFWGVFVFLKLRQRYMLNMHFSFSI